jgi:hypothetical protein
MNFVCVWGVGGILGAEEQLCICECGKGLLCMCTRYSNNSHPLKLKKYTFDLFYALLQFALLEMLAMGIQKNYPFNFQKSIKKVKLCRMKVAKFSKLIS